MISWKYSLEKINGELDLAKKKKHALDKLLNEGKVSQMTYDSFSNEVAQAILDIEAKQKTLVEKMTTKISELEQQMKTLEFLLVNSEIRHVSGEIEEDTYNREYGVLSLGLDTTSNELDEIKDAVTNISENEITIQEPLENQVKDARVEPENEENAEIEIDTEVENPPETSFTQEEESSDGEQVVTPEEESTEGKISTEENDETLQENCTETEEKQESSLEDYQESFQQETEVFTGETENSEIVQEVQPENPDSQEI